MVGSYPLSSQAPTHDHDHSMLYDQVSVNVYNLQTNSEKNISQPKNLVFNVFIIFVRVKPFVKFGTAQLRFGLV